MSQSNIKEPDRIIELGGMHLVVSESRTTYTIVAIDTVGFEERRVIHEVKPA
jgi:hypothetical protein